MHPQPTAPDGPAESAAASTTRGPSVTAAGAGGTPDRPQGRPPGRRVVLGVGGGIAAYKACLLLRLLTEAGHQVTVVPTAAALRFVGAPTWAALSGRPVHSDVWSDAEQVPHVRIGQQADLVVVAPATADLLARAAHGLADDLLTTVLLTARCPVLLAPAMHTEMWTHPATAANVATLRARGVQVLDPASGRLTGTDSGPGRLADPEDIVAAVLAALAAVAPGRESADESAQQSAHELTQDMAGVRVVVSAGGTREPLDPVRYLGNRSSGKQGLALATRALARGAHVTVVAANLELAVPVGIEVLVVETAEQLGDAVLAAAPSCDVVVMAAAVADFRPARYAQAKIKKTYRATSKATEDPAGDRAAEPEPGPTIELVRTTDVLAQVVRDRAGASRPVVVGFAAETGDDDGSVLDHARTKLARKGVDLLVANRVGPGLTFGQDQSTVHLLRAGAPEARQVGPASKQVIADAVWDAVRALLSGE